MIGADYTERIDPAALKAAGIAVVFRYLSNPGWPKNLTAAEARELLAAEIAIVLNYETNATFMLGGYSAGQACARSARSQATALGAPPTTRIYYSADFDVTATQIPQVMAFLQGAASVDCAAEVDEYGGLRLAQAAAAAGMRPWRTVAWSGGIWDPHDVARQTGEERTVGGVQVDVNEILDLAALGAWGGPTVPAPAPTPAPTTDPEDDNMPAFATGEIAPGDGAVTIVCPPPAGIGSAGWGNAWFSLGSTLGDAHVHVVGYVHGEGWSHDYPDVVVPDHGDRINPFGGPLPTGIQKIVVRRTGNTAVPLSYLIEAAHR